MCTLLQNDLDPPLQPQHRILALREVERIMEAQGQSLQTLCPALMPPPEAAVGALPCRLVQEQLCYVAAEEAERARAQVEQLNTDQRQAYDAIMAALEPGHNPEQRAFFVDGPGGTGKTFLYDTLLAAVRGRGLVAEAVASSGVAALLLRGGATAHMRFKIPINLAANSTCTCGCFSAPMPYSVQ